MRQFVVGMVFALALSTPSDSAASPTKATSTASRIKQDPQQASPEPESQRSPNCNVVPPESAARSSAAKRYTNDMPSEALAIGGPWDPEQAEMSALRTGKGWLAGIDIGEWGGELVYVERGHEPKSILGKNVEDIHRLGDRIVVVTGLAHLDTNEGMIYEVQRRASGEWVATPWRELPGAPDSSWITETGDLLIGVASGHVLVSPTGMMTTVSCLSK